MFRKCSYLIGSTISAIGEFWTLWFIREVKSASFRELCSLLFRSSGIVRRRTFIYSQDAELYIGTLMYRWILYLQIWTEHFAKDLQWNQITGKYGIVTFIVKVYDNCLHIVHVIQRHQK